MTETPEHLAQRLSSEGQKTVEFFRSLSLEDYSKQVYTEGTCWQVQQVLAHFVASEAAFNLLIQNVLAGGTGAPEDFNLDDYNERRVARLKEFSIDELLIQFTEHRQQTVERVIGLSLEDLERTGRHPFLGIASVGEMIKLIYRHNQIHARDVRKSLSKTESG